MNEKNNAQDSQLSCALFGIVYFSMDKFGLTSVGMEWLHGHAQCQQST